MNEHFDDDQSRDFIFILPPSSLSPMQPTILIVDDEKHTRDGLRSLLDDNYDTYVAADVAGAIDVLRARSDRCAPDRSAPRRRRWHDLD